MPKKQTEEVLLVNGVFLAKGVPCSLLAIVEKMQAIKELPSTTRFQLLSLEEYAKLRN